MRYPGKRFNHRFPVTGFMGFHQGWQGPGRPESSTADWDRMMREVEAERDRRVFISHEHAAAADTETVQRFAEALGPRTHVVVTLRGLQSVLPSWWQQLVKEGRRTAFDSWLRQVLADRPDPSVSPTFQARIRAEVIVDRWADAVGPRNVTVVVADKEHPAALAHTFEALLGIPRDLLAAGTPAYARNRGMTWPEVEFVRRFNTTYDRGTTHWEHHLALVREGALRRLLGSRTPAADEPAIPVPEWACRRALELSQATVAALRHSDVRVVGDLDALARPMLPADTPSPESVPLDIGVQALAGMFDAARQALDAASDVAREEAAEARHFQPAAELAGEARTRTLAKALALSAARAARYRARAVAGAVSPRGRGAAPRT